jgi:hypothetical protein
MPTPTQQWTDFVDTAGIPPDSSSNKGPQSAYVLVHSPSQEKLERTQRIKETIKSNFDSSTSWDQLKSAFTSLSSTDPRHIQPVIFLILDKQSFEDRSVVIMKKGSEFVDAEGKDVDLSPTNEDEVTELVAWRKYRAPFEEAWAVQCGIEGFGGMEKAEEHFVEEVERYEDDEGEGEGEGDEQ